MTEKLRQAEMVRLGYYGLIPFAISAGAVWFSPWLLPQYVALDFHQFALIYGGVIVAYLAGVGAGGQLRALSTSDRSFLPSMLAALGGFFIILPNGVFFLSIGGVWRHLIIVLLLIYLLLRDLRGVDLGVLPKWYGVLRVQLTLAASACIALIIVRLLFWGMY